MNEALKAALSSSAVVCAQMCLVLQEELKNAIRTNLTEFELEAKRTIAYVQEASELGHADVDQDVAQWAVVLGKWLEKVK